jgi:hypothetical protein
MAINRLCSIPDCGNPTNARGLCSSHYHRLRRYGDPLTPKQKKHGEVRRFYTEVVLNYDGDDCLIWPYHRMPNGYGQIGDKGKICVVSRMVCEDTYGPPPTSKHEAAHSCGKGHEGCVNRRHLRWVTHRENTADRIKNGTWGKKLTEETAREMLTLKGLLSRKAISVRFGVDPSSVWNVFTGRTWKHLRAE